MSGPEICLSDAAKDLCAAWFIDGPASTFRSHPPHPRLVDYRAALDDLLAAGIVEQKPHNKFGSIRLNGTDKSAEIGRAQAVVIGKREGWVLSPHTPKTEESAS